MRRGRGTRSAAKSEVPDVYRQMLAEASSSPVRSDDDGRSIKKRRIGGRIINRRPDQAGVMHSDQQDHVRHDASIDNLSNEPVSARQEIVQSSSEDSAENDINWEEVELNDVAVIEARPDSEAETPQQLNLTLGSGQGKSNPSLRTRRRPINAAERSVRLTIHKLHLCCLLIHLHFRNHWCNDENVHSALRKLLTRKIVSYLNPDNSSTQFQRSRSFMDGVQQASDVFRAHFKITARGMAKPRWAELDSSANMQTPNDIDLPMEKEDFIFTAKELRASRDVGSQLFCAMLRAAGVDARLVCSLQPLPFRAGETAPRPRQKYAAIVSMEADSIHTTPDVKSRNSSEVEDVADTSAANGADRDRSRFVSNHEHGAEIHSTSKRKIRESRYPLFWVEAFNEAVQKWIPVDPLVTQTVSKPSKLEPPAGERENNLSYVVAFEDDGSARDVTKRYAKAYNAKTRKDRVEVTEGGEKWWKMVMRTFKRRHVLDRDQLEDAELAAKEAAEPMPRNVLDFKDHPSYALERHLRRREVIHPKREVGRVGTGRGHSASASEPVYRRRDVVSVQSADRWHRMGREIKPGEQPLKHVATRRLRGTSVDVDNAIDEDHAGTPLYAIHQTTPFEAPPVVDGRIPKNIYGNLDVYVPSMVPPGGFHVRHTEAARAAKLLGIDYADAVTGFSFKGRHGTAVINGAVVADAYIEAVHEVLLAFDYDRARAEAERRIEEALKMWRRFLTGLRIRERIEGYDVEGQRDDEYENRAEVEDGQADAHDDGGGFFPDHDCASPAKPTAIFDCATIPVTANRRIGLGNEVADKRAERPDQWTENPSINGSPDGGGGGFLLDDGAEGAPTPRESSVTGTSSIVNQHVGAKELETERLEGYITDDTRGGFVSGRDGVTTAKGGLAIPKNKAVQNEGDVPLGLSHEQLDEARFLEQLYANSSFNARLSSPVRGEHANPTAQEYATERDPSIVADMTSEIPQDTPAPQAVLSDGQTAAPEVEDSEEDKGSLLSHDPDEEDVEPEWVS